MPWKATDILEQRKQFVLEALKEEKPFIQLCRKYGISRVHGEKWLKRFLAEGEKGLLDRSKKPKSNSRSPDTDVVLEIVRIRKEMDWGCGVNLRPVLLKKYSEERVPSARTIDRILLSTGFTKKRAKRTVKPQRKQAERPVATGPNDIWTIDYKGWWHTLDRKRCEPLTLRDHFTRYLLALEGMRHIRWEAVQEVLTDVFSTYGLPLYLRSDNGAPFAHNGALRGLTQLSAWVVSQGIALDRIQPGRPDQNGGHERMHRDLKRQIQKRPAADLVLQQAALDAWRNHFNTERPHRGLNLQTPASQYAVSPRKFKGTRPEIVYPDAFEVRKVAANGSIKHRRQRVFLSHALAGWDIGIETQDDSVRLWFADLYLGSTDKGFLGKIKED